MVVKKDTQKKPPRPKFDPDAIKTQAQLDAALKAKTPRIFIVGGSLYEPLQVTNTGSAYVVARGSAHVEARESAHVEAWESAHVEARGSAHVEAWGSAHVEAWGSAHVEARESAHVEARGSAHVEAWGSAHVEARESAHVEAWGSAHVVAWESAHVEAWGSAHVVAWESAHVEASPYVSVQKRLGHVGQITGGVVIAQPVLRSAEHWCAYHGVVVTAGVAILYKALNDDFTSPHGAAYLPGTMPEAKDWDGGKAECGGGLHFSPSPAMALDFHREAKRFAACPVALADMRAPSEHDGSPQKIKARRVCGPIVEVDRYGAPVAVVAGTAA